MTRNPPFFFTDNGIDLFVFLWKIGRPFLMTHIFHPVPHSRYKYWSFTCVRKMYGFPKKKPKFQTII